MTFPWRTIRGHECSGYWPASTAAFHINADIADAVRRYLAATGDDQFERRPGIELLVATARLWRSLGHHDAQGGFRIHGVTGPDEYTALVDNNVFPNLMAARNLRVAAEVSVRHPNRAAELAVDEEEVASWRNAADAVVIPADPDLGVTPRCEGFTRCRKWEFETTAADEYPLLLNFHNYALYSSQVVKQADLVFALYASYELLEGEPLEILHHGEGVTVSASSPQSLPLPPAPQRPAPRPPFGRDRRFAAAPSEQAPPTMDAADGRGGRRALGRAAIGPRRVRRPPRRAGDLAVRSR